MNVVKIWGFQLDSYLTPFQLKIFQHEKSKKNYLINFLVLTCRSRPGNTKKTYFWFILFFSGSKILFKKEKIEYFKFFKKKKQKSFIYCVIKNYRISLFLFHYLRKTLNNQFFPFLNRILEFWNPWKAKEIMKSFSFGLMCCHMTISIKKIGKKFTIFHD